MTLTNRLFAYVLLVTLELVGISAAVANAGTKPVAQPVAVNLALEVR